jgi:hypothetical protein
VTVGTEHVAAAAAGTVVASNVVAGDVADAADASIVAVAGAIVAVAGAKELTDQVDGVDRKTS